MTVKAILEMKGRDVATVAPETTVGEAVKILAEKRIGAIVVTKASGAIAGILSERDVVRALASDGAGLLKKPVSDLMTAKVKTCREDHTVKDVMGLMTAGRFRHLPVESGGKLAGIISIGDVVKRRIEDVEREAESIRAYIASA